MNFSELGEKATDGSVIFPNQCAVAYGYDSSNNLTSARLDQYGHSYIKTYTWTGSNLTGESLWVRV